LHLITVQSEYSQCNGDLCMNCHFDTSPYSSLYAILALPTFTYGANHAHPRLGWGHGALSWRQFAALLTSLKRRSRQFLWLIPRWWNRSMKGSRGRVRNICSNGRQWHRWEDDIHAAYCMHHKTNGRRGKSTYADHNTKSLHVQTPETLIRIQLAPFLLRSDIKRQTTNIRRIINSAALSLVLSSPLPHEKQ
jgi:hypothetical protein